MSTRELTDALRDAARRRPAFFLQQESTRKNFNFKNINM
jgi:hypothetical protein